MEQIIIDGINLSELKIKYDALAKEQSEMRQSIRQGSSKYISDAIDKAKAFIHNVLEAETEEQVKENSKAAYDLLKNAKFVSDVSGVTYSLPYYDRQGEYYPDGTPFTIEFDDSDNELLTYDKSGEDFQKLWGLLEDMESDVSEWLTSYC